MSRKSAPQSWTGLGFDVWALGIEASTVIGLRTMKLAAGGRASEAEARLMVSEKVRTAMDMQMALMTGALGTDPIRASRSIVQQYTRKVRANRRRLST